MDMLALFIYKHQANKILRNTSSLQTEHMLRCAMAASRHSAWYK